MGLMINPYLSDTNGLTEDQVRLIMRLYEKMAASTSRSSFECMFLRSPGEIIFNSFRIAIKGFADHWGLTTKDKAALCELLKITYFD